MGGWMDGWMDGWVGGLMGVGIPSVELKNTKNVHCMFSNTLIHSDKSSRIDESNLDGFSASVVFKYSDRNNKLNVRMMMSLVCPPTLDSIGIIMVAPEESS